MVVVVERLLQWSPQHLVSKVAVGTSPEQDVYALDVATHAGYVQRRVHIVGDSVQVTLGTDEFLHYVVVASVASFVERVVLVDEVVVGVCSVSEQIVANFRSSVPDGPVERCYCVLSPVFKDVGYLGIDIVGAALEEVYCVSGISTFDGCQQGVVLQIVSHFITQTTKLFFVCQFQVYGIEL